MRALLFSLFQKLSVFIKIDHSVRISAILEASSEGMIQLDKNGIITGWNVKSELIFGWISSEVIGKNINFILKNIKDDGSKRILDYFSPNRHENILNAHIEVIAQQKNNHDISLELTTVTFAVNGIYEFNISVRDILDRKTTENEIINLAFYDSLTKLPNRRLLMDRLNHSINASSRSGLCGSLMFIDLDNFKKLNDTLGHDIGDVLLQQVAERLVACLRDCDTVARLGGDEFVILIENISKDQVESTEQSEIVARKILAALNVQYKLLHHDYLSTPSIGATLIHPQTASSDEVLKQADLAMYQSKKSGRNMVRFFDPNMQAAIDEKSALESNLRQAIINREFELYYQIQVDNVDKILGVEALIRWNHPTKGCMQPLEFIALSEETGLIIPIGQWVLETACAQLNAWKSNKKTQQMSISINVSAKQFHEFNFAEKVTNEINRYQLSPSLLTIEITESLLQSHLSETIATMVTLRKIGVKFSLDDFGTGFSSLPYLKKLPIDQLKIDKSFVKDLAFNSFDRSIVRTIISMAKSMNIDVIAEGVETEDQRMLILGKGCTSYQGFLFGMPMPIDQINSQIESC